MSENKYLLINAKVLPPVFEGVLTAKQLLADGKASSAAAAARMAGISRSAFYKYKDFVFKYSVNPENTLSIFAVLSDKAGVFSAFTTALYNYGANIITVNQGTPEHGIAEVSLTINTDGVQLTTEELLKNLYTVEGVTALKIINGGTK